MFFFLSLLYVHGNIVTHHMQCRQNSTCFLVGPLKQMKNMFAEKRIIATIIVIISFVCTLMAAIWVIVFLLILVFSIRLSSTQMGGLHDYKVKTTKKN